MFYIVLDTIYDKQRRLQKAKLTNTEYPQINVKFCDHKTPKNDVKARFSITLADPTTKKVNLLLQ